MIKIEITDPLMTAAHELLAVADLLTALASKTRMTVPGATPRDGEAAHAHGVIAGAVKTALDGGATAVTIRTTDPALDVTTLAPEDNPAAGAEVPNPADIFGGNVDPATVFGGNAAAGVFAKTESPETATRSYSREEIDAAIAGNAAAGATDGNPAISTPQPAFIPPAPPAAASASVASVELDSDGLPWDARIHAETRSKVKAGSWKRKRGVDESVVAEVEAQLRAVLGVPVPVELGNVPLPPPPPAPTPFADTATAAAISTATPISTPVVAAVTTIPTPPTDSVPPPPPAGVEVTFPQLCAKITNALNSGALTQTRLGEVLAAHKLAGLPTLAAFKHLVQPVAVALGFA